MLIVGLFSSKDEVKEIKSVANICSIENRIHFIVKMQKVKKLIAEQKKTDDEKFQ